VKHQLKAALPEALRLGEGKPALTGNVAEDELLDVDFSSLVTYSDCSYRYWLRHVCGFQPPVAPELGFGKLLHHLVAELARGSATGGPPSEAEVDDIWEKSFYLPFAGPVPARKLREAIRRRAKAYVREFGDELTRTIQPEARFEVPIDGARVRGRIDLMLQAEGDSPRQVELIDFKTSSNRPPSETHENQLRMYAAAVERLGLEPVRLAIHDLDTDLPSGDSPRVEVSNDEEEREAFRDRLGSLVEGIRDGVFMPAEDRTRCRSCDFRRFCRYAPAEARTA
jgi:DNA helicase-2/ATP-dependent DNA helicase PcrA